MASEFARMLKSALARRIAFVVVAALLAALGFSGRAAAQATPDYSQCYGSSAGTVPGPLCPSREVAYAEAKRRCEDSTIDTGSIKSCSLFSVSEAGKYVVFRDVVYGGHTTYRSWAVECPNGSWNESTHVCDAPKDCAAEPDLGAGSYVAADPDICFGGCKYEGKGGLCVGLTVDAQQNWYCSAWAPTGAECSVGQSDTPLAPTDSDGDGSADGNDTAPNNPGQGGGGKDGKPQEDGGGKGDGNGSGEGSGNGNTSGGGGNCASPPSSSGDAILAQIAYQTWATRCAIEGAKDGNGNLKTTQGSGSGSGTGNGNGEGDEGTDFGTSNPPDPEDYDPSEHKRFGIPIDASLLDNEPIFGGGSCPVLSVTVYGKTFSTSELSGWCDLLRIIRALVLIFGAFTALRILMGHNA